MTRIKTGTLLHKTSYKHLSSAHTHTHARTRARTQAYACMQVCTHTHCTGANCSVIKTDERRHYTGVDL